HFIMPPFQRSYAWEEAQVRRFFNDIENAWGEATLSRKPRTIFLGMIIGVEEKRSMMGRHQVLELVDGQQRLATITLMLCIIRDLLGGTRADKISRLIDGSRPADTKWRLSLRPSDEEEFVRIAKTPGATLEDFDAPAKKGPARDLLLNRNFLRTKLREIHNHDPDVLFDLFTYMVENCEFAFVEANHHDDAHEIFRALNYTAMPLKLSDHIKGLVFRNFRGTKTDEEAAALEWEANERALGADDFRSVFTHIRTIHGEPGKPIGMANTELIERMGGAAYIEKVFKPIVKALREIKGIQDANSEAPSELERLLVYLDWLPWSDWVSPAIKWMNTVPADEQRTLSFFRRLERRAFSLFVANPPANHRRQLFQDLLVEIDASGVRERGSALDLSKDEQRHMLHAMSTDLHHRDARRCKLVLIRLSDEIGGTLTRTIPPKLSVEHVLPRKPKSKSEWRTMFSSNDERIRCCNLLGNLVLLPSHINNKVNVQPFAEKLDIIFRDTKSGETKLTRYALTNTLLEQSTWDADTIIAQDRRLGELVRKIWDLKGKFGSEFFD
ncbi:MAG: DUF262 domain-containing HNH endonuclease family protein, partial [Pseudomonadota bacterium]